MAEEVQRDDVAETDDEGFTPDPLIIPTGTLGKYRRRWMNEQLDPDYRAAKGIEHKPYDPTALSWSHVLVFVAEVLAWVGIAVVVIVGVPGIGGWIGGIVAAAVAMLFWAMYAAPKAPLRTPTRDFMVRFCCYALGLAGWLYAGLWIVAAVMATCIALGEGNERRKALRAKVTRPTP